MSYLYKFACTLRFIKRKPRTVLEIIEHLGLQPNNTAKVRVGRYLRAYEAAGLARIVGTGERRRGKGGTAPYLWQAVK